MKEDSSEENDVNEANSNNDSIYEMIFGIVTNITLDENKNEIKLKQLNIIEKIIGNIIEAEKQKENSEKYRRIKIDNPNISLILKIKGVYDFLIFLGFKEDFNENNLTLYLPKELIEIKKLKKSLYYMNLLHLNFIDNNNQDNINYFEMPTAANNIPKNNMSSIGENINNNNSNSNSNNSASINNKEPSLIIKNEFNDLNTAENILKETGKERYYRALNYSNNDDSKCFSFSSFFNFFTCGQCGKKYTDEENKKFFEEKEKNNKNKIITLNDLEYKNPISNIECHDDIGKECLGLTNQFREKHNLPPLEWDDSIWRIAYVHSKNMGDGIVPFGHKGFNERIKQFNFTYYRACENVFMCQGYSQYDIAENAVKGWINSPGHRQNLLSYTSHCAIAVYKNSYGAFYLTQLFALK